MDDERRRREADAAEAAVAAEDFFPASGEAGAVASAAVVTGLTEAAAVEGSRAAGAAQGNLLRTGAHFEGPGLTYDKGHYHRGF